MWLLVAVHALPVDGARRSPATQGVGGASGRDEINPGTAPRPAWQQKDFTPMKKKGPRAFDNAAYEAKVNGGGASWGSSPRPLRLLVHAVQDDTNLDYVDEVKPFLEKVAQERLPFSTPEERDLTLAGELDFRCFTARRPLCSGTRLFYGIIHIFPEWKFQMPISLRAVHSWEKLRSTWEGGPAAKETIYFICGKAIEMGYVSEAIAFLVAFDCYLREQDWIQLKCEDVFIDLSRRKSKVSARVALMLGRKHRGESVKTGQEQGVLIDDSLLSLLLWARVKDAPPDELVFKTTAARAGRVWREILEKNQLQWVGPLHTLRHSGPTHDVLHQRRSVEDVQRRGRWTQSKSMLRYAKPHALVVHKARLPEDVMKKGRELVHDFRPALRPVKSDSFWSAPIREALRHYVVTQADQAIMPLDPASNGRESAL